MDLAMLWVSILRLIYKYPCAEPIYRPLHPTVRFWWRVVAKQDQIIWFGSFPMLSLAVPLRYGVRRAIPSRTD
jgi:hypothetical protein